MCNDLVDACTDTVGLLVAAHTVHRSATQERGG